LIGVLICILLFCSKTSIANIPSSDLKNYYVHGKKPTILMQQIKKYENVSFNNKLLYKNDKDLIETCKIICKNSDSTWSEYDLTTFAISESKLSKNAINKLDGGKGLFQLTHIKKHYKKELSWVTNPFNKEQNTKAAVFILNDKLRIHGNKHEAIKRYNGSGIKASKYRKKFYKIKYTLKNS